MKVQRLTLETMKIKVYTKSPMWWTSEEWKMSEEEREKIGIKLIDIEYNRDTSAGHPTSEGDDIVRTISKDVEL